MDSTAEFGTAPLDMPPTRFHSSAKRYLTIHRLLPFAVIYFFFNRAGLPFGLFYTSVFSLFLFLWLYLKGRRWLTAKFLLVMSPFLLANMANGVASRQQYLRSLILLWTVYIAVYAFCWALMKTQAVERLLEQLILLNFCIAILGIVLLPTPLRPLFWMDSGDTIVGMQHLVRMNLLLSTSEPSAYAELMLPLLVFAAFRLLHNARRRNIAYFIMILVPFLLCQSFGGISVSMAAIGILVATSYRPRQSRLKFWAIAACLAMFASVLLLIPNPISARVIQVVTGNDGSTNVRTFGSYLAAYTIASSKSLWWGAGPGQGKFMDVSYLNLGLAFGIPNSVAGTLAEFGIIGLLVRFMVEIYLFFRTKVYQSSFRLAMFVAAFIIQLTGSYLADVQVYVLWLFAFYPIVPELTLHEEFKSKVCHS